MTDGWKTVAGEVLMFRVRDADEEDATVIHALGCNVPELDVGGTGGSFPALDDLDCGNGNWVVLESSDGNIQGFCLTQVGDTDRSSRSACVVYIYVRPRWQRKGFAKMLLEEAMLGLQSIGVDHVYAWAHPESGVVEFLAREGFKKGKPCIWMDVDLSQSRGTPKARP